MIRHANCGDDRGGSGLATAIISLAIGMVETSFRTLLVPAAGCTQLLSAGLKAAVQAAIALPPVRVGGDQEESAAAGGFADWLREEALRVLRDQDAGGRA